jgi:hypothetical protein
MKNEKTILWIMITGIFCIVITPFLFTHFGSGIDFTSSNTNNIGGTIGGITAPFTGILGSILVYFALKEQVTANKLIQRQLDEQKSSELENKVVTYLKQQLETIITDLEQFQLEQVTRKRVNNEPVEIHKTVKGTAAIHQLLEGYLQEGRSHDFNYTKEFRQAANLNYYLSLIDELVKSIRFEIIPTKDREYLLSAIKYHYVTKVKPIFEKFEENKNSNTEACRDCGLKHHGIPDELFEITSSINRELNL